MTRELLVRYHEMSKVGDHKGMRSLLADNAHNKRFVSLIELREAFLTGFREEIERRI